MVRAVIWTRVSTSHQENANQERQLVEWARRLGVDLVDTVTVQESAWSGGRSGAINALLDRARRREFDTLLIWSLDRLTRQGVAATIQVIQELERAGVQVLSHQETWLDVQGPTRELLLSIFAWIAQMESSRRSERVNAGLERARAEGKHLGRPKGSVDKQKRKRAGYYRRWESQRE